MMDTSDSAGGFLGSRVIQIHPTLRCNLRCEHCYSYSGPAERGELDPAQLLLRLERLRGEGYEVISFSGGEPLLYRGLDEVGRGCRELGFRVNLITNGMLLSPRRLAALADYVSVLGISLDGSPEQHDTLRGRTGAFDTMSRHLPALRDHGISFGFAHCVTSESIRELPWLLEYALEVGAALLQLHPLASIGRASETCDNLSLSADDLARVFVIAQLMRVQAEGELSVQLDLSTTQQLTDSAERYPVAFAKSSSMEQLSDLINPLVMDESGRLWPLAYGMADKQCITPRGGDAWDEELDRYVAEGCAPLRHLLLAAFEELKRDAPDFVDWYAFVAACSHRMRHQGADKNGAGLRPISCKS